jgi:hypothetical protein
MRYISGWCLLAAFSILAPARTIKVPATQPTIQAGINAAENGDVVMVAPGTYLENINFYGKAITVKSSRGAKVTIIDGGGAGPIVTFAGGEGPNSVLEGFTIQHGSTSNEGGGIYISTSSPTVEDNIVTENTAGNGGGGIAVEFSSALVKGNTVTNNSQVLDDSGGVGGGGILVGGAGAAEIIGNIVENNNWLSAEGGGISLFAAGAPALENNIVTGNAANDQGGGIWIVNESNAVIVQNLIYNNTAFQGSGIYFDVPYGDVGPVLVNNTIAGTSSSSQGSAVYADGFYGQVQFFNNLMIGPDGTNAVYCQNGSDTTPPTFTSNDSYSAEGTGLQGTCSGQASMNGNVSVDPMFRSQTNFHVRADSPIIGAGDISAPDLPAKDLSGRPRIVDGEIDMGAYEYPK